MSWRVLVYLWAAAGAAGAMREDTARLLAHAKKLRDVRQLSGAQYREFHAGYLEWIDARIRAGDDASKINAELVAAGLLQTSDDFSNTPAGYLHEVSVKAIRGADDLMAIVAGMYMGPGCSLDDTAILYQRSSLKRFGWVNGDPTFEGFAYILSGIDAGAGVLATGWTISNCTSTWNGKLIRIDRVKPGAMENVLRRELSAQDRWPEESISARVREDAVTFWYSGAVGDSVMLSGPSIARYRVDGNRATRESPIALTRAGFLHEWVEMNDAESTRWSTPEAARAHHSIAADFKDQAIHWEDVTHCGGAPPVWEVTVRLSESGKVHVFRIGGGEATELRMLGVPDKRTPSCTEIDGPQQIPTVGAELPW
jgi:hypothetical protein